MQNNCKNMSFLTEYEKSEAKNEKKRYFIIQKIYAVVCILIGVGIAFTLKVPEALLLTFIGVCLLVSKEENLTL